MKPRVALCIWLLEIFREDNRVRAKSNYQRGLVVGDNIPLSVYTLVACGYEYNRIKGGQ
jgi:hypothetical protein